MIRWPGADPGRTSALTTTVDLHATLCELFGIEPEHVDPRTSLVPILDGSARSVRDHVLAGYWSRHVYVIDDERHVRALARRRRVPARDVVEPVEFDADPGTPRRSTASRGPTHRATLGAMPGTTAPVIRQPFAPGDLLPFWAYGMPVDDHHLYDVDDVDETENLAASPGADEVGRTPEGRARCDRRARTPVERLGLALSEPTADVAGR